MPTSCPRCGKQFRGISIGSHRTSGCPVTSEDLFWQKVAKAGPDECWLWTGCVNTTGRAMAGWNGTKNNVATRIVWELTHGPIPEGQYVLHRCDVRRCCNPAHLFLGTYQDNATDRKNKGRGTWGELTKRNKLTAAQVQAIRTEYVRTGWNRSNGPSLAKKYGVDKGTIAAIIARRSWANLKGDVSGS